jgi:hypothetical protein
MLACSCGHTVSGLGFGALMREVGRHMQPGHDRAVYCYGGPGNDRVVADITRDEAGSLVHSVRDTTWGRAVSMMEAA